MKDDSPERGVADSQISDALDMNGLSVSGELQLTHRRTENLAKRGFELLRAIASAEAKSSQPDGAALKAIRADLGDCTRCKLHGLGRQQIVFGDGNPLARLMFIGEAPGFEDDKTGQPFSDLAGQAGRLLTNILRAMGLSRGDVYIANVIKCRPPDNRRPAPDEVSTCESFLLRQIEAVNPTVVVTLGSLASKALLKTDESILQLRGRVFQSHGVHVVPTFHPAYLLRTPSAKRETWADMKVVMKLLGLKPPPPSLPSKVPSLRNRPV